MTKETSFLLKSLVITESLLASECSTARMGIISAWSLGFYQIILEWDSSSIISYLNGGISLCP